MDAAAAAKQEDFKREVQAAKVGGHREGCTLVLYPQVSARLCLTPVSGRTVPFV
jgi:hypothetical protein